MAKRRTYLAVRRGIKKKGWEKQREARNARKNGEENPIWLIPFNYGRNPAKLRAATSDFSHAGSDILPSSTAAGFWRMRRSRRK